MKNIFRKVLCNLAYSISFCCLILLLHFSSFAETLTKYKKSIDTAILELTHLTNSDEGLSETEQKKENQVCLTIIRDDLLSIKKIDNDDFEVETENAWFKQKLDEAEKLDTKSEERLALLNEAIDRLNAITIKIDQAQKQVAINRTKDQDKQKLEEILNRPEFKKAPPEKEEKEKSAFEKWKEEMLAKLAEYLMSLMPKDSIPNANPQGMQGVATFLQVLVVTIAVAIIGYLIYRFLPYFAKLRPKVKKKRKTRVILGETILADQDSSDVFAEAELLAKSGDTRGAVRKGYIAVLCSLGDRKIIGLAQHKTNRDYLFDLRKRNGILPTMKTLTQSFERHWYGFDSVSESDWQEFRTKYQKVANEN
jgi:Domain of unknown function (DUF4129)